MTPLTPTINDPRIIYRFVTRAFSLSGGEIVGLGARRVLGRDLRLALTYGIQGDVY
jgi:hypothetical protein